MLPPLSPFGYTSQRSLQYGPKLNRNETRSRTEQSLWAQASLERSAYNPVQNNQPFQGHNRHRFSDLVCMEDMTNLFRSTLKLEQHEEGAVRDLDDLACSMYDRKIRSLPQATPSSAAQPCLQVIPSEIVQPLIEEPFSFLKRNALDASTF